MRLTPEQQRIAIAEWCGWKYGKRLEDSFSNPGKQIEYDSWINPSVYPERKLPDFLNDLNAMWEAEARLSPEQWGLYEQSLASNDDAQVYAFIHATATQKAKSLLVAIGKWTDGPTRHRNKNKGVNCEHG